MIEKILPVVDNFERGLAAVPEERKRQMLLSREWIKYISRCSQSLTTIGVKPIEAVGKEFDPELPQCSDAGGRVKSYDAGISWLRNYRRVICTMTQCCKTQHGSSSTVTRHGNNIQN